MKANLIKETDRNRWRVYVDYYDLEGKKCRLSRVFKCNSPNAKTKATTLKRKWDGALRKAGSSGIMPPAVSKDIQLASLIMSDYHGVSFCDMAKFYKKHHKAGQRSITCAEVCEKFITMHEDRNTDAATVAQYRTQATAFGGHFEKVDVCDITGDDIIGWVTKLTGPNGAPLAGVTVHKYYETAERVLRYAKTLGYLKVVPTNPDLKKLLPPEINRQKDSGLSSKILSPEQGKEFFAACEARFRPMLTVKYFTGLRDKTGQKMTWKDVDLKRRRVVISSIANKKNKESYLMRMPARMWELLESIHLPDPDEPLFPSDTVIRKWRDRTMKKCETLDKWPQNGLRHSFASYNLNFCNPEGSRDRLTDTLMTMTHTDDPTTFFNHYAFATTCEDADEYFDVRFGGISPIEECQRRDKNPTVGLPKEIATPFRDHGRDACKRMAEIKIA